jgi:uncharacterized membrane protein YraQ (UPF0718 family)
LDKILEIIRQFGLLIIEIAPYFVLGVLAGAVLKSWLPVSVVERYFKPGIKSILALSVLGGLLPVCSCSMVPLAQSMRERGAALGAVVAFLVVAPVLSPVTIVLTWGWLGAQFTLARVVAAFAGAFILGILMERFRSYPFKSEAGHVAATDACGDKSVCSCGDDIAGAGTGPSVGTFDERTTCACGGGVGSGGALHKDASNNKATRVRGEDIGCGDRVREVSAKSEFSLLYSNLVMILKDLWGYLLIGIAISAVVSVLVPRDLIPSLVGNGPLAYLLAAVVGVPTYVCSGEEVPIAKALLNINLPAGATFTFLLSVTGICLPTILMASKFLGKRNAALYALFWFVFSICAGLVFSAVW